MKHIIALLWACSVMALPCVAQAAQDDWKVLGVKDVSDRADHDTVHVTAARGEFNRIKLEVRRSEVRFYRVVVRFGDGSNQEIELRESIRAGGESRSINLRGDDRVIREIEFWYEAKELGNRSATIRVLGRK
jgi:hypothetical protein